MKVAIVHDDLIQFGGAESLMLSFFEIWPDAILYTSYISDEWKKVLKSKNITYKTSFMQFLPFKKRLNKFYGFLYLFPLALESFRFRDFDLVISSSTRFAHCVITQPKTLHISYINSPGRMFWEFWDYFENVSFSKNNFINKLGTYLLSFVSFLYRTWDYYASFRPDYIIANSKNAQDRVLKYYKKNSHVIYPFVDTSLYENTKKTKENFFLIITRLVPWKRVDIAIEAFKKTGKNLRIIGDGPHMHYLKSISAGHKNIEFLGRVSDAEKIELLCKCSALVQTQLEDFGIVPLEAMSAGKPVIAYGKGGALETIVPNKTGVFFNEQTSQSLIEVLNTFDSSKFLISDCVFNAKKFDKSVFFRKIKNFVNSVYL